MSEPIKDNDDGNDEDNKKGETFQSLSDRDLDLFTNQAAARSYYMSSHEYDYDIPPGKSFYSMHMDTTKQQEPAQWLHETPLHFTHASWLIKHLSRSYSSFHDWDVSGSDTDYVWSPSIPEGKTNHHLITKRTFTLKMIPALFLARIFGRFYNPNIYKPFGKEAKKRVIWKYIITIHYRKGIDQSLCRSGYGRWSGEIVRAVTQKQTRTILSFNFEKVRGN